MNPLLPLIIAEIVKHAPALALELVRIFSKEPITDADWAALQSKYAAKTYDDYISAPASASASESAAPRS